MWRKDIKYVLKSPLALLSYLALFAAWQKGTSFKIQYILETKDQVAHSVSGINLEAAREYLSAVNGYVIFQEGLDDAFLPLAIAIVAGLLFSARFLYEKNTGFGNYILTRRQFKLYFAEKCAFTFGGAFLFVFLSCMTFLLLSLLVFSFQAPTRLFWTSNYQFVLMDFFEKQPFLFSVLTSLHLGLFAGLFSLFGMGMSLFTSNRFLVSLSPTALFLFCVLFPQMFPVGTRGVRWIFLPNLIFFFGEGGVVEDVSPPLLRYGILLILFSAIALIPVMLLYVKNKKSYLK